MEWKFEEEMVGVMKVIVNVVKLILRRVLKLKRMMG